MRKMLMAGVAAVGLGVAASSGAVAAPVNGVVLGELATGSAPVTQVYWHRHYWHHHYWHHHWWHHHYWRHHYY